MTLPMAAGIGNRATEPVAHSSKAIEGKGKCWTYLHCLFHILLVAAGLAVIYWGLMLGKVFRVPEADYTKNPPLPAFRPPAADAASGGGDEEKSGD
jgi:hypothetical protein